MSVLNHILSLREEGHISGKMVLLWIGALGLIAFQACDFQEEAPEIEEIPAESESDTAGPDHDYVTLDLEDGTEPSVLEEGLDVDLTGGSEENPGSIYSVRVKEGEAQALVDKIWKRGLGDYVDTVEESVSFKTFGVGSKYKPNDPLYPFQWNLDQINMRKGWQLSRGEGVTVAVIDTGVNYKDIPGKDVRAMEDLEETSFVSGYDFNRNTEEVYDPHGHGTHVAGTIAQSTDNKYGVAGVAYNATIMPIKVLDKTGRGSTQEIAKGVRFAVDNGADIINLSLGSSRSSKTVEKAVKYAENQGVTVVAAAGNSGKREPSFPAAYDATIAVAATQYDRTTAFYSQKGEFVDIAAPGGNTDVDQNDDGRPDGVMQETIKEDQSEHDFVLYMGTSMASPHVAGVAALLYSWGINHPDAVESYLKRGSYMPGDDDDDEDEGVNTSDHLDPSEKYGAGIVQADRAIKSSQFRSLMYRLLIVLLLGVGLFMYAREEDFLGASAEKTSLYMFTSIFVSVGLSPLFFIPYHLNIMLPVWAKTLLLPIPEWDLLLGASFHQNPILVSALIPALGVFLTHGHKYLKYVACGLAVGFASFNLMELFFASSNIAFIPGTGIWDKLFLLVNAAICVGIAYLSLLDVPLLEEEE